MKENVYLGSSLKFEVLRLGKIKKAITFYYQRNNFTFKDI